MSEGCPRCGFAHRLAASECPRCGVVFHKLRRSSRPPTAIEPAGRRALAVGLATAVVVLWLPFLSFVFGYLTILVHELGHAAAGWAFGYPSIPAFDFAYGGGITSHESRKLPLVVMVLAAFGWGLWRLRERRRALVLLGAVSALYGGLAASRWHEALILFMGHGAELLFAGVFLYRAISGSAIKVAAERPLYAFVGFFIVLGDLRFAWGLIHDPLQRAIYEEAKGGGHWMDFSRLAERHLHVDLGTVAGLFWLCCLVPPAAAWAIHRHRDRLLAALEWLCCPRSLVSAGKTPAPEPRRSPTGRPV